MTLDALVRFVLLPCMLGVSLVVLAYNIREMWRERRR